MSCLILLIRAATNLQIMGDIGVMRDVPLSLNHFDQITGGRHVDFHCGVLHNRYIKALPYRNNERSKLGTSPSSAARPRKEVTAA